MTTLSVQRTCRAWSLAEAAAGALAFAPGLLAHDGDGDGEAGFPTSSHPSLAAHVPVPQVRAPGKNCSEGKGWGPGCLVVGFGYTGEVLPAWSEHLPRGNPNKIGNWTEWGRHWVGSDLSVLSNYLASLTLNPFPLLKATAIAHKP